MAIGFKLDSFTHDFVYSDGALQVVLDSDEIARNIKTRLLMAKGEYALDRTYGFPYKDLFGARIFNLQELESVIKGFILSTEGVKEFTRFVLDYVGGEKRELKVDFTVKTIYEREIELSLPVGLSLSGISRNNIWRETNG